MLTISLILPFSFPTDEVPAAMAHDGACASSPSSWLVTVLLFFILYVTTLNTPINLARVKNLTLHVINLSTASTASKVKNQPLLNKSICESKFNISGAKKRIFIYETIRNIYLKILEYRCDLFFVNCLHRSEQSNNKSTAIFYMLNNNNNNNEKDIFNVSKYFITLVSAVGACCLRKKNVVLCSKSITFKFIQPFRRKYENFDR